MYSSQVRLLWVSCVLRKIQNEIFSEFKISARRLIAKTSKQQCTTPENKANRRNKANLGEDEKTEMDMAQLGTERSTPYALEYQDLHLYAVNVENGSQCVLPRPIDKIRR